MSPCPPARLAPLALALAGGLLALARPAHAGCAEPGPLVDALETAVIEARFDGVRDLVTQVEAALACTEGLADPALLGRLYRAQGAWLSLSGATDEAALAWRSAQSVDPGGWTPAFGDQLAAEREAAVQGGGPPGTGSIVVTPAPVDFRTAVDGVEVALPASAPPGFHLVQVLERDGGPARFARQVLILAPDEQVRVETGPLSPRPAGPEAREDLAAAPSPTPTTASREHTRWPLWAGLGAAALGGGSAALARLQRDDIQTAATSADLQDAYGTQQAYAWTAYGLWGLGAVGVGVGLAL